jgi:hypothetical protein
MLSKVAHKLQAVIQRLGSDSSKIKHQIERESKHISRGFYLAAEGDFTLLTIFSGASVAALSYVL